MFEHNNSKDLIPTFINSVLNRKEISVLFDVNLRYVLVNDTACNYLNKRSEELIGKTIMDLYPQLLTSQNLRNLIKAAKGNELMDVIEDREGTLYATVYQPLLKNKEVRYVHVVAYKRKTRPYRIVKDQIEK
jgi:PAS domain-containing protein